MEYTISTAFVIDVDPEKLADREADVLHQDIVNHMVTTAELMRAKYPERQFRCILADMIVTTPEHEIAPR